MTEDTGKTVTHAMLLAAGMGKRMRPLTDQCPKPLLKVNGKPLIVYHLERIRELGITDVVINVSYLADQIQDTLGSGERFDLNITYSYEAEPLETAGGIVKALPFLGHQRFLLINADVWINFNFSDWISNTEPADRPVSLVMVDNPSFHPTGDFNLLPNGLLTSGEAEPGTRVKRLTYAGVGIYTTSLFQPISTGYAKLAPYLIEWMKKGLVAGVYHDGAWSDVGTPERLALLQRAL